MKLSLPPLLTVTALMAILPLPASLHATEVATKGAEPGKWTMDYDAATKLAKEKDLPLLINFTGSDWCGWCKLMDKEVYAKPAWGEYAADHLVTVTIDFPNDKSIVPEEYVARNKKLSEKFGVQGYPTYMILDSDGETVLGQLGAGRDKTPDSFIAEVNDVLRYRPASIEAKVAELGPEKGKEYQAALDGVRAAEQELNAWIKTSPERNEDNEKKYKAFLDGIESAKQKVNSF